MSSSRDNKSILQRVDDYYSDKIRAHGATPQGVDWNSTETQDLRFRQLSSLFPTDDISVTDFGCGYGGYYDYLSLQYDQLDYLGVDISEAMVELAQDRHRDRINCRFVCADRPPVSSDYVVASGIFNVRQDIGDAQWLDYLLDGIETMNATSKLGFAFNCLTSYSDAHKKRSYLYYADPCAVFDACMKYSRNVTLLHGYGLYEFTILVRKEQHA